MKTDWKELLKINEFAGVEYLRAVVDFCDHRYEVENENKTPRQLMNDFDKEIEK